MSKRNTKRLIDDRLIPYQRKVTSDSYGKEAVALRLNDAKEVCDSRILSKYPVGPYLKTSRIKPDLGWFYILDNEVFFTFNEYKIRHCTKKWRGYFFFMPVVKYLHLCCINSGHDPIPHLENLFIVLLQS